MPDDPNPISGNPPNKIEKSQKNSSFTVHHQVHQVNLGLLVNIALWFAFFSPLSAKFQIENAFALPYIGVNALCCYGGLGIFALGSIPVHYFFWTEPEKRIMKSEQSLIWTTWIAVVGASIKLFSYINHNENGVFGAYAAGHLLICLSICIHTNVTILVTKFIWRDTFALLDCFGAISIGLVLSTIITHFVYVDTDKFFTKVESAQTKNFGIMVSQLVIFVILAIYNLFKKMCRQDSEHLEDETVSTDESRPPIRAWAKLGRAQPFAILFSTFFFLYLKLPQFASLFWFTQNQGEIFLAFFSFGFLLGSQNLNFVAISLIKSYRIVQAVLLLTFIAFIGALDGTAQKSDLYLLCCFAAFIGAALAVLISLELFQLDRDFDSGSVPVALTLSGLYSSGLCALGDKTHYMNRDDPTWSYIDVGLSAVFVSLACLFTLSWFKRGCRCCSCCCRCCLRCCGRMDEDDEQEN